MFVCFRPPWYVELYGFQFNLNVPGNPAGFIHFDQIMGLRIFSSMYSKNANVFAAIPSLHAAYPLLTVLYGSLSKKCWLHFLFVVFTLFVWFSAVYSRHHYVLDVLAGGICALTAFFLYRYLSRRSSIERFLDGYSKLIWINLKIKHDKFMFNVLFIEVVRSLFLFHLNGVTGLTSLQ